MDTEILVENRIEDGRKLIAELVFSSFDVSVALWVKTSDEGLWSLYIGSTFVQPSTVGDAYRQLYGCLEKIPDAWIDLSEVKLIPASDPIALEAIAARDRQSSAFPIRFHGRRLGSLPIEEAYVYPRVGGQMTPEEILQTLTRIANRPAVIRPAVISLQDGTTLTARITGFNLQLPGNLTINTLDSSNMKRQIHGDEIISIQP